MTLMTKLYDNLLCINNQPLQLLYLIVKMTTTMSENVTKYDLKSFFSIYCYCCCVKVHVTWLQHTPKGHIKQGKHINRVITKVGNPDD